MKKVSVIIPAYNKAEYTKRTIESVLAQSYKNIEIIVVDDGSRDQTAQVMAEYGNRIVFIQKANGGACSARNEGIRHAKGEYIAFIDCDDLYVHEKIECCVDDLEKNASIGFVYTAAYFIDENDKIIRKYNHPDSKQGSIASQLILGNFICNSTVVVRKTALDKAGFFDETIFTPGDWDMWLRLSEVSQVGYIPEPLTKYRTSDNYIFNRLEQAKREEIYVLEKFFKTRPHEDGLKLQAFSNLYLRFAQCAYIKKDLAEFWKDCKECVRLFPWNVKGYMMMVLALFAPHLLKEKLEQKILRRTK